MLQLEKEECGQCGACIATCRFDALRLSPSQLEITMENCTLCGECVLVCPAYALKMEDEQKI
ncbi:MAG: 4Fe-4S binding protein [candidate division Zixibacteria bacterium]|nr:4Fe-4S binding protein [candidate division Zixibacteria bacterium]